MTLGPPDDPSAQDPQPAVEDPFLEGQPQVFTCEVNTNGHLWRIWQPRGNEEVQITVTNNNLPELSGPFQVGVVNVTSTGIVSQLTVTPVDESLNNSQVECRDASNGERQFCIRNLPEGESLMVQTGEIIYYESPCLITTTSEVSKASVTNALLYSPRILLAAGILSQLIFRKLAD